MKFFTFLLRESSRYWVALCLENGVVGQGESQAKAVASLKDALASLEQAQQEEPDIETRPVAIKELHEFLTVEPVEPKAASFELRVLYA